MNVSKDYEQISIGELKSIFEKRTNMSFTVLCINDEGITSIVPIGKADILFPNLKKCGCNSMFAPETTKYFIQKTLKKHFQGQNEFYKRTFEQTGHGETLVEIKDWLNSKIKLFNEMNSTMKENYFMDLYNAITHKKYVETDDELEYREEEKKHNNLIVEALLDLGVLMRVLAVAKATSQNLTLAQKVEHDRVTYIHERLINDINNAVVNHIKLNRNNENFMKDILSNRLLQISFPLSHSIRVFVMYTDFLLYYNEVFNRGLVKKIRKGFEFYQRDYDRVFVGTFENKKSVDRLEDVFKDSMQAIQYDSLESYASAALVHDIGKFYDMDYYISGKDYDEKRVQKHLFRSCYMINGENHTLNKIYTVAFHHEYYGLGYGPFNAMYKGKKTEQSYFYSRNVISYDIQDVLDFEAIAYFPAKVLEIVDVYDMILHPWFDEQDFQASTVEGVLDLMRKNYVERDIKLDPILFDVFISYLEDLHKGNLYLYKTWNTNY